MMADNDKGMGSAAFVKLACEIRTTVADPTFEDCVINTDIEILNAIVASSDARASYALFAHNNKATVVPTATMEHAPSEFGGCGMIVSDDMATFTETVFDGDEAYCTVEITMSEFDARVVNKRAPGSIAIFRILKSKSRHFFEVRVEEQNGGYDVPVRLETTPGVPFSMVEKKDPGNKKKRLPRRSAKQRSIKEFADDAEEPVEVLNQRFRVDKLAFLKKQFKNSATDPVYLRLHPDYAMIVCQRLHNNKIFNCRVVPLLTAEDERVPPPVEAVNDEDSRD
jgi:hypothetical protein